MRSDIACEIVPGAKKPRGKRIPDDVFVTIWHTSGSAQEAADRLSQYAGSKVEAELVVAKADRFRRQGVLMKQMA